MRQAVVVAFFSRHGRSRRGSPVGLACAVPLALAAFAGMSALTESPAEAYCRKTTNGPTDASYDPSATQTCGDGPNALPLFWRSACVEYSVVVEPALQPLLSIERARAIVASAAQTWSEAPCPRDKGGLKSPTIRIVDVAAARCDGSLPNDTAKANNEIRFFNKAPEVSGTLAVTTNLFGAASGTMTEATVTIYNTGIFDAYANDVDKTKGLEDSFSAVIRHEMGHFLGLAHSDNNSAIMYAFYNGNPPPGLTDDDIAAICDVYDPSAPVGAGCSVAPTNPANASNPSGRSANDTNALMPLFLGAAAFAALSGRVVKKRVRALRPGRPRSP